MKTLVTLTLRDDSSGRLKATGETGGLAGVARAVHGLANSPDAALRLASGTFEQARLRSGPYLKKNQLHVQSGALTPLSGGEDSGPF